jgi:phosphate transport system protein
MEVEIDRDLSAIIARRQPTARDLRLLIAISKTIANLERVGDEAARIARTVQRLINTGVSSRMRLPVADLSFEADLATAQLRKALDAFARLDVTQALQVLKQDDQIDQEFDGLMRKLITYMMEDPRTISPRIDLVFVAKAIERVGDHAKNLAEAIIYIVKGTDVRHTRWKSRDVGALNGRRSITMSRVLVVEDEAAIAELIAINLRHAGIRGDAGRVPNRPRPGRRGAARPGAAGLDAARPVGLCMLAKRWRPTRARASCPSSCSPRACRRGDKIVGLDAGRRRLPDQAVLHQGTAGPHPRVLRRKAPERWTRRWKWPACGWTRPPAGSRGAGPEEVKVGPTEFRCCTS